ncbi:MAG TPA: M23 family metallopeptidase [Gemmatimonadaceae bacterium]|nr:M23 family metallopeptidase [Gemmatimonadaceae bacterium]
MSSIGSRAARALILAAAIPAAAAGQADSTRRDSASADSSRAPTTAADSTPRRADAASIVVSTRPTRPTPGTLLRVSLVLPPGARVVGGELAGEPLHFAPDSSGSERALGGVPVDASDSLPLRLWLDVGGAVDTVVRRIALAPMRKATERLTVARTFGQPPDSATTARIEAERLKALAVSRRAHETPQLWTAPFRRPRASVVTSTFGTGRSFNGRVTARHLGVDFRGAEGAPVHAANRGVVALVDSFHLAGNVVYLDHGAGLVTAYFHLSRTDVAPGDTVSRGQLIGAVGATGRVTGPHLHWVARYGAVTVDPMGLLILDAPPKRSDAAPGGR